MKRTFAKFLTLSALTASFAAAAYMWLVRFTLLTEAPIYDEVYSLITASPAFSFPFVWKEMLLNDVNLPLFNVLLHAWAQIVPFTIPWMRVLPAIFAFLLIPAAGIAAPKNWPKLQKFTLCALLAGSFSITSYAATLRAYSMAIFGVTLCTLWALGIAQQFKEKHSVPAVQWVCFFGVGFLTAWLHYFGAALFFTACLWLFVQTLLTKKHRKLVFAITALCFAGWFVWIINIYYHLNHFQTDWWFQKPLLLSTWEVWTSLLGTPAIGVGILCFIIIGLVSIYFKSGKEGLLQGTISLPIMQLCILIALVWGISHRYNLWIDRYFLLALPSLFILLAALFAQLVRRNCLFVCLLPLLLINWTLIYWHSYLPEKEDPSGLTEAFEWIATKSDSAYVLFDPITYPKVTQMPFLTHYLQGAPLQISPLVAQAKEGFLVVPLCSFVSLMQATDRYQIDVPDTVILFKQTCVITL